MIKVIKRTGQIVLDYKEFMKTRRINADELNCGHYIIPFDRRHKHCEETICPYCKKKAFYTGVIIIEEEK